MDYKVLTDVGVVRSENQDRAAVLIKKDGTALVIVCDGMGGHQGGSHASRITIETFEDYFYNAFPNRRNVSDINNWFNKVLKKAKKKMLKYAGKDEKLLDMGTTITMAIVLEDTIRVFNIGDSRVYIYNGLLHQITMDHNVRNLYIQKFNQTPEEAQKAPQAMALTSAFGPRKTSKYIDDFIIDREPNMIIMASTDGIHDYIKKPLLESIISSNKSLDEKANKLIEHAIKGHSADNLTVALLEVKDGK